MMSAFNFDNSMLRDFAACEAAAIARHVFGLRGKGEKVAADIGSAFHVAIELHFRGRGKIECVGAFEEEYDKIVKPGEQPEEARFARQNCIKILEQYCEKMPPAQYPFEAVSFEETKGVGIESDADGELVFWVKRDLLGKDRRSGALCPVDHKTTGRLTTWWARKFRLTSQLSGYCWFTGREYGQAVGQAYVNAIQVDKLPDSMKRCAVHGVKYVECGPEHATFQVYQYTRSAAMVEKWKQDAIILAKKARVLARAFSDLQLLKYAWRNGAFNDACMFCEFKEWCAIDFEPSAVEAMTVFDPWTPWNKGKRIDAARGFEGIVPGTEQWMRYWKEHPAEQGEMVEWMQRAQQ